MTTQTKFAIAFAASTLAAAWGAYEILGALFHPIIRSLGG
jgi:hypothetical protein